MEKCFKSHFFPMFTFIFISRESFYLVFSLIATGDFGAPCFLSDLFLGVQRFARAVRSLHHLKCLNVAVVFYVVFYVVVYVVVMSSHIITNRMQFYFFQSKCVVIVSSACHFPTRGGMQSKTVKRSLRFPRS